MKKKNLNSQGFTPHLNLLFLSGVTLILVIGLLSTTIEHEFGHVSINNEAGVKSHIEFSGGQFFTIPDNNFESLEVRERAYLAHGINEAVGYQLTPLVLMLCGIIIICTIYLGGKLEK